MLTDYQKLVLAEVLNNEERRLGELYKYWKQNHGDGDAGLFYKTEVEPFLGLKTKLKEIHELF